MSASHSNFIELVKQQDAKTIATDVLKFLSRHLFLILVLLWTPLILFQTWNVQHSCFPLVNWAGDRCPIERGSPLKLTMAGHDFTCSNLNCSGIQSDFIRVMLQTAEIHME